MLRWTASNLDFDDCMHAFFGRKGGISEGIYSSLNCGPGSNDKSAHVLENRRRAVETLASGDAYLATLYQVHGRTAVTVRETWEIGQAPKADAMATDSPGLALGILTADCAPVLFAEPRARVIGAAHAGWKGALQGVIESAVEAMELLGARRERIAAAIGPCISQASYEVGDELRVSVVRDRQEGARFFVSSHRAGHWQFDLGGYVQTRLQDAGIKNVSVIPACTYEQDSAFFSYRRATHRGEPDYGRQLSAIMLR